MPTKLISCISLPPATIQSVPIYDFAKANEDLANLPTEQYYACCGKSVCGGCIHSFRKSGNIDNCPYCRADKMSKTAEENVEELMKRAEANDATAMFALGSFYDCGQLGVQQDAKKAMELWTKAAELGSSSAHFNLGNEYQKGGYLKKARFHYEAAAMAGNEAARCKIGAFEGQSGNMGQAVKHWMIAASAGDYMAIHVLVEIFKTGTVVSRDVIDSTLTAYNNSCAEMRGDGRDAYISVIITQPHGRGLYNF
jgi:TPR repeat protein